MALFLPPAVSVNNFVGGYRAVSDYSELRDTETSVAENMVYGPGGDLNTRTGSRKLLNQRLANTATLTIGEDIVGHYYFKKLGDAVGTHIVMAGDSVYSYNSSTAVAIQSGLTDNSQTFFTTVQIQDPRSASDDIVVYSNGVNKISFWNGSGTAAFLDSITSASQVPIAKYILTHKNRIYAANIVDATNVDTPVKVAISSFGPDGAPDPHRFLDSFFVGGSSKQGEITGFKVLNDQIIIYTKNATWKFSPGSGNTINTSSLFEIDESVGVLAPFSLIDVGGLHIFLSQRGVFGFDGSSFVHISKDVDIDLLDGSNQNALKYAKAVFNKDKNQYILYYAHGSSTRNNRALVYDLRLKIWQPPITGRFVNFISTYEDGDEIEHVIYGDYHGFLYQDDIGTNDGVETGFNGTITAFGATTLTDTSQMFPTANNGLAGVMVKITSGAGLDQARVITSNDSQTITIESAWTVNPNTASTYTIAGYDKIWRSKDYSFGAEDIVKLFRAIYTRTREEGNFELLLHYIVDFKDIAQATLATLSLLLGGMTWGISRWGQARWGSRGNIRRKVSLRSTQNQSVLGTHLALRYSNRMANQGFRISGFDIDIKPIGKR